MSNSHTLIALLASLATLVTVAGCRGEFGFATDDGKKVTVTNDGGFQIEESADAGLGTTPDAGEVADSSMPVDTGTTCSDAMCGDNASCMNGACVCDSGFGGDPMEGCTPGDPCAEVECAFGATCNASGECLCDPGFEPDGNGGCLAVTPGDTASRTAEDVCQRWIADFPMRSNSLFSTDPSDSCDSGILHPDTIQDALRRTSLFRWLVGLPAVTSNPEQLTVTQACATTLAAENAGLTHTIPDTFECYSQDARTGAASSNIARGVDWPAQSVDLYVGDNNVPSLGHRRWVFNPSMGSTGFGQRDSYSCMYSFDRSGSASPDYVAYPPPGPIPLAAMRGVWSFHSSRYTFTESADVEVLDVDANTPLTVADVYIPSGGYGQPTLAWTVSGAQADTQYEVRITGLGGIGDSVIYRTTLVSCQ